MLHKEIIEAIENNKDISLNELDNILDAIELYGALDAFNKLCKEVSVYDMKQIHKFNSICANYIRMNNAIL